MGRRSQKLIAAFVRSVQQPGQYWYEHGLVLPVKSSLFIPNLAVGLGRAASGLLIRSSSCPSIQ